MTKLEANLIKDEIATHALCSDTAYIINQLINKAVPKPPNAVKYRSKKRPYDFFCPYCTERLYDPIEPPYCDKCGQALDWNAWEEKNEYEKK